ncbi:MAG: hypothetical protein KGO02_09125, partial [Alphaproteobacteria bacterium]|nr:hypothetical protein [Alphaproteobacteria bacterium]
MTSRYVPVVRCIACAVLALALNASAALACACGCGVFDVGTASLFAGGAGGTVFFEYDFMNQHEDWQGTSRASKLANSDQKIRTSFMTLGGQYMLNRAWGVMGELPVWQRHFETMDGGSLARFDHTALGDIRLMGIYSGLSADMSTGI